MIKSHALLRVSRTPTELRLTCTMLTYVQDIFAASSCLSFDDCLPFDVLAFFS